MNQYVYEGINSALWWMNIKFQMFPSRVITWFVADTGKIFVNKLPAILADVGIGYLIYVIASRLKSKKAAVISLSAFVLSPPIWYNSAVWGQTESLFALPLLLSFWLIYRKRMLLSSIFFMLSLLVKPMAVLVVPVFAYYWLKKSNVKSIIQSALITIPLFVTIHMPFHPQNLLQWIIKLYRDDIREVLGQLVANAFNVWSLLFGFEPIGDSIRIFGFQAFYIGLAAFLIFAGFVVYSIRREVKLNNILLASVLISFAGFMFLTRIHERYFYLTLLFLAPLVGVDKQLKKTFWVLSGVHFINLYHYWWVPRIPLFVDMFGNRFVEQSLVIINLAMLAFTMRILKSKYITTES